MYLDNNFILQDYGDDGYPWWKSIEVVGNIYENPELLEEK